MVHFLKLSKTLANNDVFEHSKIVAENDVLELSKMVIEKDVLELSKVSKMWCSKTFQSVCGK